MDDTAYLEARFWSKVKVGNKSKCWPWLRNKTTAENGYGRFSVGRYMVLAHRVAWELTNGAVPDDLCVLHRCDNRLCCNPEHLFLGTYKDNSLDMVAKGRHGLTVHPERHPFLVHPGRAVKGEKHSQSKVTDDMVRDIRRRYESGESGGEIQKTVPISIGSVYNIINRRTWGHVD